VKYDVFSEVMRFRPPSVQTMIVVLLLRWSV